MRDPDDLTKPGTERSGVCSACKHPVVEVFTEGGEWHPCEVRTTTRIVTGNGEVAIGRVSHSRVCLARFRRR